MQVRLLGPVDVVVGGAARTVSGLRRKAATLLDPLDSGEDDDEARPAGIGRMLDHYLHTADHPDANKVRAKLRTRSRMPAAAAPLSSKVQA